MAEHLGCRTMVVRPASEGGDRECGHLLGQHRDPDGGVCQIGGCGCPTYTPPRGQAAPPVPGVGHHVDLVDPEGP